MADDSLERTPFPIPPTAAVGYSMRSGDDLGELPSVLTSKEAARVLRVGVREVRQLVDSGQLPGARFGPRRVIRIAKSAVLALLQVGTTG
jgi:excisionase family DNA binding protein